MEKTIEPTRKTTKRSLLKALILIAFIATAIFVFRFTPVRDYLRPGFLKGFLAASGFWAPVVFIAIFAASVCLFFPAIILVALGGAVFGAYWGFLYSWMGAMAGASGAFFIGRILGRDFVQSLIRDRLEKYDNAVEKNGFATVLYLRLLNTPFTYMNFGLALTKVRFWDYFFGTGIGVIVGIFVIAFLGGTLKHVWTSGNLGGLVTFRFFFAVALFIFSFFIPKIIKKAHII